MATMLSVDYKSQLDPDANASRNDCGPACLAMLLNAFHQPVTTDAVFSRTGAPPDGYISMAQLMRVAESYGLPLEYHRDFNLGQLRAMLDLGRPLLALVHYGVFSQLQPGVSTQSVFQGPHFVLVVGYDDQSVSVHDPLWTAPRRQEGAYRRWPLEVWMKAWGSAHLDCDAHGNCNPDYAVLVSARALDAQTRTLVPADVLRRLRAKAAFDGAPLPDLSQPVAVNAAMTALGAWGQRTVARVVQPTDTATHLALAYYGDANRARVILYFNGLSEGDVIRTGQVLLIPEPTQPGALPEARTPAGMTSAQTPR